MLTLKEQVFPERVVPVIHVIAAPTLSTILHEEYVQGLVVESEKYYVVSRLTY